MQLKIRFTKAATIHVMKSTIPGLINKTSRDPVPCFITFPNGLEQDLRKQSSRLFSLPDHSTLFLKMLRWQSVCQFPPHVLSESGNIPLHPMTPAQVK